MAEPCSYQSDSRFMTSQPLPQCRCAVDQYSGEDQAAADQLEQAHGFSKPQAGKGGRPDRFESHDDGAVAGWCQALGVGLQ